MNKCEICDKEFGGRKKKYCSPECKRERDETVRRGSKWKMVCQTIDCDKVFYTRHKDQRFYSSKCRTREEYRRKSRLLKKQLLHLYGDKCACCGESTYEFLTLEHKRGNGKEHRKAKKGNYGAWQDAIEANDSEEYEILCMNCNWAKGKFGYCPHEKDQEA